MSYRHPVEGATSNAAVSTGPARFPGTERLLTAAAVVLAGLSMVNLWWAAPAGVAAFQAGRRPGRTGPAVLALVTALAAGVLALSIVPGWLPLAGRFVLVMVAGTMAPWFAGRFWRQYRELARAGWQRAEQLQREQALIADQIRLRERARIARDMHDLLGHDLSLLALSAGALKLAPGLAADHRRAAADIRARAAAAVERLGEVIGVLREETDGAPAGAHAFSLATLTAEAAAAGLAVELRVDGAAADSPPMVERTVHRVVRETLTNVVRHAPGAAATVQVTRTDTATTVLVRNGPPSSIEDTGPRPRGGGRGLAGLQERVRLAGGSLEHGPYDGGFVVTARVPHTPASPSPPAPVTSRPAGEVPREHHRARRTVRRSLAIAVLVPLVSGALLSGVQMGWETLSAARSVLAPGDYARLRVGQDRSVVAPLLPERQTSHRPLTAEPPGEGTTCEYYAMTADRFDDRSGDAYRLCFRGGTLVSLDALAP